MEAIFVSIVCARVGTWRGMNERANYEHSRVRDIVTL